ncbi:MAG TPA: zinc ribbon domain-containing protein [Planctomycetota bacterium]
MPRTPKTFPCPHCGEPVRSGARSCRECGSDAGTGWAEDADTDYAALDLPEPMDDADYEDFLARELGTGSRARAHWFKVRLFQWVAIGMVVLLLVWAILGR